MPASTVNRKNLTRTAGATTRLVVAASPALPICPLGRPRVCNRSRVRNDGGHASAGHNRTEVSSGPSLRPLNRNAALSHPTPEEWHQDDASGTASAPVTTGDPATIEPLAVRKKRDHLTPARRKRLSDMRKKRVNGPKKERFRRRSSARPCAIIAIVTHR